MTRPHFATIAAEDRPPACRAAPATRKKCGLVPALVLALAVLTAFLTGGGAWAGTAPGPITWRQYGQVLGGEQKPGKPVLIYFMAPWCYICKDMHRKVWPDPRVAGYFNDSIIPVKIDSSVEEDLSRKLGLKILPSFLFMDEEGREIMTLQGRLGTDGLLAALSYVAGGHYKKMDFATYQEKGE